MKALLFAMVALLSVQAHASHEHDRVCVGNATIAGQSPVQFVFQWEIARTYENGDPNKDPHTVNAQIKACDSDYAGAECVVYAADATFTPPQKTSLLNLKFKSEKGEVFFDGQFDISKERLIGRLARGWSKPKTVKDPFTTVALSLSCISQPEVALKAEPASN